MKKSTTIFPPTKQELITLRMMILLGLLSMGLFLISVFNPSVRGDGALYWMLISTLVFTCLRVCHEWIHYFYITVPQTPTTTRTFTVDIFTTFCAGEPYEMIEETLIAIKNITYPHKSYLCDESNDPYLKKRCNELGVYHITRKDKRDAKAGNINNALTLSKGELCVVLDPDHVPQPDFLDPIVSYFQDPQIGFVQIVQSYSNNEESLIAKGAAQQTYQFYGPMMMTMNKYGTVLAIGANCTFRRSALESIGGHAAGLAEDMHTAMKLHSKGWKSVYVPAVLARGLVPSTLSAYYKQQLKWARGVFDLFFTAYPKLFKGFTWQQKLHYGVIPFHYLSGLIVLTNFLIPIFALFFNKSPLHMNLEDFGLLALPFVTSLVLIRHFVQKWVMEDRERGFHVVGGLLMLGTWWIYILGLVYTLFKKKVPYVPTPKDDNEANNWPLNIPNIAILVLSLAAIGYGLWSDWNPYNLIMAGFAGMNCLFMCFNIVASRQQQFRIIKKRYVALSNVMAGIRTVKVKFWLLRRGIYAGLRSSVLIILFLFISGFFYLTQFRADARTTALTRNSKENYFLTGIFLPNNFNGQSSLNSIARYQDRLDIHFDLVSYYIPWGEGEESLIPERSMDSVYRNGSIPLLTWEPWQNLFKKNRHSKDKKVFARIVAGDYDLYIKAFANRIKALNRPVFIRFAHEFDNPFYPWSATGDNTAEEFKGAWRYIYQLFKQNQTNNVIWVWNPWEEKSAASYFPGESYVDWIGVTSLNYGSLNSSKKSTSMAAMYEPYHNNDVFKLGLPVMLAEMGSLQSEGMQKEWFDAAFRAIRSQYPEIKGIVYFNSAYDKNLPSNEYDGILNWNIDSLSVFLNFEKLKKLNLKNAYTYDPLKSLANSKTHPTLADSAWAMTFANLRGMNYRKGHDWMNNYKAITNKEIIADFKEMKELGVDHVKIYGPSVYDRNIFSAAAKNGMKTHYAFWIPDRFDYQHGYEKLEKLSNEIIQTVRTLKNKKSITSWNIGNPVLQRLSSSYFKPALFYQQDAYLRWLRELVDRIREADSRPITVDIEVTSHLKEDVERIHQFIPMIDAFGLVVNDKTRKNDLEMINKLRAPFFLSRITEQPFTKYQDVLPRSAGQFISNWEDDRTTDFVSFDGVKDYKGRDKRFKRVLSNRWTGTDSADVLEKIKILKPAKGILEGQYLTYYAIINRGDHWDLAKNISHNKKFEWKLVRTDGHGNFISMEELGEGDQINVRIPKNHFDYRLYLYVIQEKTVISIQKTTLHTPLVREGLN